MTNTKSTIISPPKVIFSIRSGFDALTENLGLLIFPFILDIFLWFGPHLGFFSVIEKMINDIKNAPDMMLNQDLQSIMKANQDIWLLIGKKVNVFTMLRTYPVGVPSIMTSILPVKTPLKTALWIDLSSLATVFIVTLLISLFGILIGAYYFSVVSQSVLNGKADWITSLVNLPKKFLWSLLITLFWLVFLFVISIPASCILTLGFFGGETFGKLIILLYGSIMLWIFIPIIFSVYGVFVFDLRVIQSIKEGIKTLNYTLPATGIFLLVVFIISQGLDLVWRIPDESSWLLIIGVIGHAFVSTGLLASSFIFYRDANKWSNKILLQRKSA